MTASVGRDAGIVQTGRIRFTAVGICQQVQSRRCRECAHGR
jgi:hypothetical protein